MKVLFAVLLSFAFLGSWAQPDTTLNLIEKGKVKYRLEEAKVKLINYDYRGALKGFREVLQADKENAVATYHISECYYLLKRFKLSKKYIDKVKEEDLKKSLRKNFHLMKGKIYHRNEELDKALEYLEAFKTSARKRQILDSEVDNFIQQCQNAKAAMKVPLDVAIENVGTSINTANPEYAPSVTADGKTMIFTSRRADTKGGGVDLQGDHKYFEDIYISYWDEEEEDWTEAESIPGSLNTEYHDACLSITPDGKYIYIYRNIMNVTGSGDIYISKKSKSGKWGTPKAVADKSVKINTSYMETSACQNADGTELYFLSERPGGGAKGMLDIYSIKKMGRDGWGDPVNLSAINTKFDESFVSVHESGNYLFFASDGPKSLGGKDIFVSKKKEDGTWGEPQNLGYPINTVKDEGNFTITSDGKTAYIAAFYKGSKGERDIFKIDLSKLDLIK